MKLHEYQAKELFRRFGIPVPKGGNADSAEGIVAAASQLAPGKVVVKAQIHAGGRGKGGGVKLVDTPAQAGEAAAAMLGTALVTKQTGPEGRIVRRVLVEEGQAIAKEWYVAVTLDRATGRPVVMVSPEGGMDIEEVAEKTPEKIFRVRVDPRYGLQDFEGRFLAKSLGLEGKALHKGAALLKKLVVLYHSLDASLVEINPLVQTASGDLLALDAKMVIDDNALYRHPDLVALADPYETDPLEQEAEKHGLNYIRLSGTIGAMVNGAGLAMATMDLIKQAGGEPANFLDVGGGASAEKIAAGFRIILSDERVKGILINIFGGILRCDILAQGVVQAARETGVPVPMIVRLQGTNAEEGQRILNESGIAFTVAGDLKEAAQLVAAVGR